MLKTLTEKELHIKTAEVAKKEKASTYALLEHLFEIDTRRAFLHYPSLFEYVVKELHYSECQAAERIGAMRLIFRRMPEAKKELESGRLSLTSAASAERFFRKASKAGIKVSKTEVLGEIIGKSKREVEKTFEMHLPTKTSPTLSVEADKELLELIDKFKDKHGDHPLSEIFKIALKTHLTPHSAGRVNPAHSKNSRYIPVQVRVETKDRSGDRCEYVDPITKKRCKSQLYLQFDHIDPFAYGGTNDKSNIRHLCRGHNLAVATQTFGRFPDMDKPRKDQKSGST